MKLVEGFEFRWVALCGFNEQTLVGAWRRRLLCRTSESYHGSGYSNCREQQKVTRARFLKEQRLRGSARPLFLEHFPSDLTGWRGACLSRHMGIGFSAGGTFARTGPEGFRPAFLS
jgi:hypothetical protein